MQGAHVTGQKPFQIQLGEGENAFFQKGAATAGKIGASDALIENNVAAKQRFLLRPVKSDGTRRMSGSKHNLKDMFSQTTSPSSSGKFTFIRGALIPKRL